MEWGDLYRPPSGWNDCGPSRGGAVRVVVLAGNWDGCARTILVSTAWPTMIRPVIERKDFAQYARLIILKHTRYQVGSEFCEGCDGAGGTQVVDHGEVTVFVHQELLLSLTKNASSRSIGMDMRSL